MASRPYFGAILGHFEPFWARLHLVFPCGPRVRASPHVGMAPREGALNDYSRSLCGGVSGLLAHVMSCGYVALCSKLYYRPPPRSGGATHCHTSSYRSLLSGFFFFPILSDFVLHRF